MIAALCSKESQLRLLVTIFVIFAIQSCASTSSDSLSKLSGCWTFNTAEVASVSNTMTLCINEEIAEMDIYYPNQGDNATICSQSGKVRKNKNATFLAALDMGTCENGRELSASNLICGTEAPFLRCVYVGGGPHMKFDRKGT